MSWSLQNLDTEETALLAEWGLSGVQLRLRSQEADQLSFVSVPVTVSEGPVFAGGTRVALYHDSTCVFRGRVDDPRVTRSGGVWRWNYSVSGPWWYLDHVAAQQAWTVIDHDAETEISANKGRILFGVGNQGQLITTGEMLSQFIAQAVAAGVPISPGTVLAGMYVPDWSSVDVSLGEAMRSILAWHPTAVAWWDYAPLTPKLNIRLASTLDSTVVDGSDRSVEAVDSRPRTDLQPAGVVLKYERVKTIQTVQLISGATSSYVLPSVAVTLGRGPEGDGPGPTLQYEYVTPDRYPVDAPDQGIGVLSYSVDWRGKDIEPPTGVAEAIFTEGQATITEGKVEIHEAEATARRFMGRKLTVANDPGANISDAIVSEVAIDIDGGRTTVNFGPSRRLSAADWIALLARRRQKSDAPESRATSARISAPPGAADPSDTATSGVPDGFDVIQVLLAQTGAPPQTIEILAREAEG